MATIALTVAVLEEEAKRSLRRNRIFRDRLNAWDSSDDLFIKRFRLSKELAKWLCEELRSDLQRVGQQKQVLSVEVQVLTALKFFASGGFQRNIGDDIQLSIHQSSVSRTLHAVVQSIIHRLGHYVHFPNTIEQQTKIQTEFYELSGFPGILGTIDCTHIAIRAPPVEQHEEAYVCRKGYHSINVQLVCDANLIITNVLAKYPGATHDAFIWKHCNLFKKFLEGRILQGRKGWLLGDSGYPLQSFLLTPLPEPSSLSELAYNKAHSKARNRIECCNGVLKQRFRCLHMKSAGGLQYCPEKAAHIITACTILHNLCIIHRLPLPEEEIYDTNDNIEEIQQESTEDGITTRRQLILQRF